VTRLTTNVYLPVRRAVERRKSRRQARKELAQAAKQREQLNPRALAEMVAEGHSNLEVAHQLYIPAEQVRRDVKRIVKFLREEEDAEA
jgi:DNA-binding NarL/FixJ family response regulator